MQIVKNTTILYEPFSDFFSYLLSLCTTAPLNAFINKVVVDLYK